MRKFVIAASAVTLLAGPAIAQVNARPQVAPASGLKTAMAEGVVHPSTSPLRFASYAGKPHPTATFTGRVEISGTYVVGLEDDQISASLWLDERSRKLLPHWDIKGEADQLDITNSDNFAKAVLSAEELVKLKSGRMARIRGQASIVADEYATSLLDCDLVSYKARFVSVLKNVEFAGDPGEERSC